MSEWDTVADCEVVHVEPGKRNQYLASIQKKNKHNMMESWMMHLEQLIFARFLTFEFWSRWVNHMISAWLTIMIRKSGYSMRVHTRIGMGISVSFIFNQNKIIMDIEK